MDSPLAHADLLEVEGTLWVLTAPTGIPNYDFRFESFLHCRHPWQQPEQLQAVARIGAVSNYEAVFAGLQKEGITLINTPEEHHRASELPGWYPLIADLTPKSIWTWGCPDPATIAAELGWPVFLKGTRQTSQHRRSLSIIEGPEHLEQVLDTYASDPILHWQGIVCRKFVPLRLIAEPLVDQLPSAFEFRTFWWKGELAGCARYWWEGRPYHMTETEAATGLALAREAAQRLRVPFLVVDIAQSQEGHWLVIECNDGQESGHAGASPIALWQTICALEKTGRQG